MRILLKTLHYLILSLLFVGATACVNEDEPEWSLKPGDELPEFNVVTLDGDVISKESFVGKQGYIIFFSTTCGDCRRELPHFEEEYRRLMSTEGAEVEFICISRAEGADEVRAYWEENGLTMPVAAVADRSVYDLFASIGIPRLYTTEGTRITEVRTY